jgi:acetyl-CoA carboxylase carboxyl transferase subunit alpha
MVSYLEFEKPLAEIYAKAEELRAMTTNAKDKKLTKEINALEGKASKLLKDLYENLSPWRKCQVARHPERPHCKDYIETLFEEYIPLAGDRNFADDHAIMGGLARFGDRSLIVIGHEKGSDTKSRIERNFGMARPEGYRKAVRLMDLANRFNLPVLTLVDTPGAYPGKGAEERGQSEAIARTTQKCLDIGVPLISVIIGEGGSGGAVAFATANKVVMLEHSIYSVISPEGCASILWKDPEKMREAAEALRLTAQDLKKLTICDVVIPEPIGGAQRHKSDVINAVGNIVTKILEELENQNSNTLIKDRRKKYLNMGSNSLEL